MTRKGPLLAKKWLEDNQLSLCWYGNSFVIASEHFVFRWGPNTPVEDISFCCNDFIIHRDDLYDSETRCAWCCMPMLYQSTVGPDIGFAKALEELDVDPFDAALIEAHWENCFALLNEWSPPKLDAANAMTALQNYIDENEYNQFFVVKEAKQWADYGKDIRFMRNLNHDL